VVLSLRRRGGREGEEEGEEEEEEECKANLHSKWVDAWAADGLWQRENRRREVEVQWKEEVLATEVGGG